MNDQDLQQIRDVVMECLRAHQAEGLRIKYVDLHNQQVEQRGNVSREWLVKPSSIRHKDVLEHRLGDDTEGDTTTQGGGV